MPKYGITISDKAKPVEPVMFSGDFKSSIEKASSLNYDAVEIHVWEPSRVPHEQILASCENEKMDVCAMATGGSFVNEGLSFIHDDSEIRKNAVTRFKECVDLGAKLNCKVIVGLMRGIIDDFTKYPTYYLRLKLALDEVIEYADKKKVRLVLEPINRFQTNYINSLYDSIELIQEFKTGALGLHIDTFHMNIEERNLIETIKECAEYIEYVHYSDSNRMIPGAGHIDFLAISRCLSDIGYDGYITLETLPKPTAVQAAENGIKYLRAIDKVVSLEKIAAS